MEKRKNDAGQAVRLMTVEEFALARNCSPKTVRRRIFEKKLPVIRTGRLIRIHPRFINIDL